jgi:starch-binding outer membrane protein, SusD/RagB family
MNHDKGGRRGVKLAAAVLGVVLAAGCEVTNPGPVPDEALVLEAAQQGFVNGAKERLTRALGQGAYSTAFIARELFPGGTTGSYGQGVNIQAGSMQWNESGNNSLYPNLQQARWIAEEAVRRLTAAGTPATAATPQLLTEAYLWAGYAGRMLGENYCEAVIDGSALLPGARYFTRADSAFTQAIAKAPNTAAGNTLKTGAYAGRAQVRVWLKNWAGAAADAALVPDNFVLNQPMDFQTGAQAEQRNHLYFGAASTPYRSYSVRHTFFDQYYTDTGDPRTPWIRYVGADTLCVGSLQGYGRVPCLRPWKYKTENDPMRLSSGREMRLIEAEAILSTTGNIAAAMAKINQVRTSIRSDKAGNPILAPWPVPATVAEAWTLLKRERGIELWLEMRRMGDQRRWDESNTPGSYELPNYEGTLGTRATLFRQYLRGRPVKVDGSESDTPRILCYNISDVERNANPNIDDHSG